MLLCTKYIFKPVLYLKVIAFVACALLLFATMDVSAKQDASARISISTEKSTYTIGESVFIIVRVKPVSEEYVNISITGLTASRSSMRNLRSIRTERYVHSSRSQWVTPWGSGLSMRYTRARRTELPSSGPVLGTLTLPWIGISS